MKKYSVFILVFLILNSGKIYSQLSIRTGAGPFCTTGFYFFNNRLESYKTKNTGIFLKGIYNISEQIHFSPSFLWVVPNIYKIDVVDGKERTSVSSFMFDINGHYVFKSSGHFEFYCFTGLDILFARRKYVLTTLNNDEQKNIVTDNTPGLNLGAGALVQAGEKVKLFAEMKYLLSKYDQLILNVGFLINLQLKIKEE